MEYKEDESMGMTEGIDWYLLARGLREGEQGEGGKRERAKEKRAVGQLPKRQQGGEKEGRREEGVL
jgi:hypothetical protein